LSAEIQDTTNTEDTQRTRRFFVFSYSAKVAETLSWVLKSRTRRTRRIHDEHYAFFLVLLRSQRPYL